MSSYFIMQNKLRGLYKRLYSEERNVRLLKYESKQLHHLCDKLIAEGKLTLEELKSSVDSRKKAKVKLFGNIKNN